MAQIANIVLKDSADADKTFKPGIKDGLVATWSQDIAAVAALDPYLSIGLRKPAASTTRKVTVKSNVPYSVTENGVTRVQTVLVVTDIMVPIDATIAATDDALAFHSQYLLTDTVKDTAKNGRFPY